LHTLNKPILIFISTVLVLLAAFVATQTAKAAGPLCVDPGNTPTCYATIQEAVDAAVVGDTINVVAGTYAGQINVNKSVTILGDPGDASPGPGPSAPVIDGGSLPGDAFLLANGVSNVTIQGFEMRNFTSPSMDGIGNGISAWEASTSNITIQDNYFHHLGYNGVLVGNDGAAGDHTNWLIKGNVIENFGYIGFELTNTSNSSIENNVIHMTTPFIGAIFSSARRTETGLAVKNNQIDGTPSTTYPVIYIYAYDLDMPNPNLDSVLIEGNTITSVGTPFQIYIRNIGTGTVTGVQVHNNSLSTLKTSTPALIDATNNWWGEVSGPVTGAVLGNVNYVPWYMDAAKTTLDGPVHNVTSDTYHLTIQAAINSANPGDTINVAAGTYTEVGQIVINNNLTIIGADKATTIVKPAQDTGTSGDARGWFLVNSGVTFNLSNVTLDGDGHLVNMGILSHGPGTIENNIIQNMLDNPSTSYAGRGVAFYDANMTVRNNFVQNFGRIGIYAYGAGVTAGVIDGNTVIGKGAGNWLSYGVELEGGAIAEVMNNEISNCQGVATDTSTSAGMYLTTYFAPGTAANVHNNIFSKNTAGIAAGYDASDTSALTAHYNQFLGNDEGISSTAPTVDATHNWWDSVSGPGVVGTGMGDKVSTNVNFSPWCMDATCTFPLTVTAQNQSIPVGSADPSFTFGYSGFVNDETSSDLTTAPTCSVSDPHAAAGAYDIVCSSGAASNYTFNYVNGTLTVTAAPLALPIFADVPLSYWASSYIERLYNAGITGGCSLSPLSYCPDSTVTRAQMAVFLLKGIHGSSYTAPAIGTSTGFTDVPVGYWAAAWIKQLAAEGITGGCGTGIYCPDATVTRAQMAIFLLKAEHGSSYAPSAAIGTFTDVPVSYWAASWIERLAVEGITSGCGTGTYCPDAGVTRAQMAVFLVKTFNLP
jgi:hypothetical protein